MKLSIEVDTETGKMEVFKDGKRVNRTTVVSFALSEVAQHVMIEQASKDYERGRNRLVYHRGTDNRLEDDLEK